jgi:hypothetical protein
VHAEHPNPGRDHDRRQSRRLTPAGATATVLPPWTINALCDASGNIVLNGADEAVLQILGVGFSIKLNAISTFLFAGSIQGPLNLASSLLTISSSSLTATPGGSAGSLRGSFRLSPAIIYLS